MFYYTDDEESPFEFAAKKQAEWEARDKGYGSADALPTLAADLVARGENPNDVILAVLDQATTEGRTRNRNNDVALAQAGAAGMDEMAATGAQALRQRPSLGPYDVAGMAGQGSQDAAARGLGLLQTAATQGVRPSTHAEPMYQPVQDFAGAVRTADARTKAATEEQQTLDRRYAAKAVEAATDEQARALQRADAMARAEQVRAEDVAARQKDLADNRTLIDKAAKMLVDAPEEDPGRYWASRTGFQKFLHLLAAAMKGWLQGSGVNVDPLADLNAAKHDDIMAQRSNRAALGEKLTARERQADQARASLTETLGVHENDRVNELRLSLAHDKEALARMNKMAAEYKLDSLPPQAQLINAALQKQIAQTEVELDKLVISTPRTRTEVQKSPLVRVKGPDGKIYVVPRKAAETLGYAELKASTDLRGKGIDIAARGAEKEMDVAADAGKAAAAAAARTDTQSAENRRFIARETGKAKRVRTLAQDLLDDIDKRGGDIPGVGSISVFGEGFQHELTAEARQFQRRLKAIAQYDITDLTGAHSSPEQAAVIGDFLTSTSLNEDQIVSGLQEIQRAMDAAISTAEAVDPNAAREMRTAAGQGAGGFGGARVNTPAGKSSVVDED